MRAKVFRGQSTACFSFCKVSSSTDASDFSWFKSKVPNTRDISYSGSWSVVDLAQGNFDVEPILLIFFNSFLGSHEFPNPLVLVGGAEGIFVSILQPIQLMRLGASLASFSSPGCQGRASAGEWLYHRKQKQSKAIELPFPRSVAQCWAPYTLLLNTLYNSETDTIISDKKLG